MTTCPWPASSARSTRREIAVVDARLSHGRTCDAHQEGGLRIADQDLVEIKRVTPLSPPASRS
jgi:hypothetical protein